MSNGITIVMGGSGGLGREVMKRIDGCVNFSLDSGVDFTDEDSVTAAVNSLHGRVQGVINCAGVNGLYKFEDVTTADMDALMHINAYAFPLVVRLLMERNILDEGAPLCNVISNASRIPMTHSIAYNASKAAQGMITRQMARELRQFCIFGVEPNKLEGTGMSRYIESQVLKMRGWSAEEARKYQLAALPAGVETPPHAVAYFIKELMHPIHHPFITGCIFPYGGP